MPPETDRRSGERWFDGVEMGSPEKDGVIGETLVSPT